MNGPAAARPRPAWLPAWLLASAAGVFLVLLVGGITRLTHSGLSIVQWQPLVGALPPLGDADWDTLFAQYRASPEYRLVNAGMSLEAFRAIFWWEYAHRLLARLAGLVFVLPLLGLLAARRIPRPFVPRLVALLLLGGLQGALGWFMVRSGLVDDPQVSPLRLAAHLGLALLLLAALLWSAWELGPADGHRVRPPPRAQAAVALVYAMALTGAIVAGTRAGLAYDTFPLMNGALVPDDLLRLAPWYRNLRDNPAMVQFVHRSLALAVLLGIGAFAFSLRRSRAGALLACALALQIALGIAVVLSSVALPVAGAHQAGAVLLFAATLWAAFHAGMADGTGARLNGAAPRDGVYAASSGSAMAAPRSTAR